MGPIAQDERIGCTQQPASCPINQALEAPSVSASPKFAVRTPYSVPATCIICLPRDRLSFFVPACGRTGRTDRRRGTRARARARARGRAFTVLVKAFCPVRLVDTRYYCVITRWGQDLIRKALFHQPEHSEIKADPHWPAAPGNNLRSREDMWQARDQAMNFDDEQHQDV